MAVTEHNNNYSFGKVTLFFAPLSTLGLPGVGGEFHPSTNGGHQT